MTYPHDGILVFRVLRRDSRVFVSAILTGTASQSLHMELGVVLSLRNAITYYLMSLVLRCLDYEFIPYSRPSAFSRSLHHTAAPGISSPSSARSVSPRGSSLVSPDSRIGGNSSSSSAVSGRLDFECMMPIYSFRPTQDAVPARRGLDACPRF